MNPTDFAQKFRDRTKKLTINIISLYKSMLKTDESRIVGKQLLRSASSVGANYRATCRARSKAEFFSKMCIVIEEADETLFWLEIMEETNMAKLETLKALRSEVTEVLSVLAKARNTMRKNWQ